MVWVQQESKNIIASILFIFFIIEMTNTNASYISYADNLEHSSTNHDLKGGKSRIYFQHWKGCKTVLQKGTGIQ